MLFLGSGSLDALGEVFGSDVRRVAHVDLADPQGAVRDVGRLAELGYEVVPADEGLDDADAIFVSGGNPYLLLARLRETSLGERIVAAVRGGRPYAAISAGAIVAGPSLEPIRMTSPFAVPDGLDLAGLDLVPLTVLPHHEREGRADRHRAALVAHGLSRCLVPLYDAQAVVVTDDVERVAGVPGGRVLRSALPGDREVIAAIFERSGRAGWSFLGADVLARLGESAADLAGRLARRRRGVERAAAPDEAAFVSADRDGVGGFVAVDPSTHELTLLYVDPDRWGDGSATALTELAVDAVRAAGGTSIHLWTEERNARPLAFYARLGFTPDGGVAERVWHGARLRELRLRRDLA